MYVCVCVLYCIINDKLVCCYKKLLCDVCKKKKKEKNTIKKRLTSKNCFINVLCTLGSETAPSEIYPNLGDSAAAGRQSVELDGRVVTGKNTQAFGVKT